NNSPEALNIESIKSLSNTRNKDLQNAYENYFIAKKNVSVARAAINPVSTGYILGIALGANYLWLPVAVNAVLSLPTKFYNVQKNKALENSQYWSHRHARKIFANEAVNLYLDIMTNEFILKSIDLELELYSELFDSLMTSETPNVSTLDEVRGTILSLQKEALTISDVVVKERAALRTLLSYGPETKLELAQDTRFLSQVNRSSYTDRELENIAFENSDRYNAQYWMYQASIKNLKMVRWSLISFNGLNFTYGQRVKIAKTEKRVAAEEMNNMKIRVKEIVIDGLNKLNGALAVQKIKEAKSQESLNFNAGIRTNYENGQLSLNDYVMTAVDAIRDFRQFVAAHYKTLANVENLEIALGKPLELNNDGILEVNNL
ncbi:unnamed protein product, partial [Chrysoparadoxa australica]